MTNVTIYYCTQKLFNFFTKLQLFTLCNNRQSSSNQRHIQQKTSLSSAGFIYGRINGKVKYF